MHKLKYILDEWVFPIAFGAFMGFAFMVIIFTGLF
jgi:hypothetical protein